MPNDTKIEDVIRAVREARTEADRLMAARAVARRIEQDLAELGDVVSMFVDALTVRP